MEMEILKGGAISKSKGLDKKNNKTKNSRGNGSQARSGSTGKIKNDQDQKSLKPGQARSGSTGKVKDDSDQKSLKLGQAKPGSTGKIKNDQDQKSLKMKQNQETVEPSQGSRKPDKKSLKQHPTPGKSDQKSLKPDQKSAQPDQTSLEIKPSKSPLARQQERGKRRIALLSFDCHSDGSVSPDEMSIDELAASLVQEGMEVHIFTRMRGKELARATLKGVHYHRIFTDFQMAEPEISKVFNSMIYEQIKRVESQQGAFDIIHCFGLPAGQVIKSLKDEGRRHIMLTLQEHGREKGPLPLDQLSPSEKELITACSTIICTDQNLKDNLRNSLSVPEDRISLWPSRFNWEVFQGTCDAGEIKRKYELGPIDPTVLFVGEFTEANGPDILMEAVPPLLKNNPQLRFVLVGDGEMMWPLRIRAHYLYIEGVVRLVGHKEGNELYELFQSADIIVVPNRRRTTSYQVLAGWSAKKPVVATEAGGYGLIRHEVNGIQIYDSPSSLVWGIERILFDWNKGHEIAQKGWDYIHENYTMEALEKRIKEIYR
ncbi:MAG: glycosyltransferase family 4 protein [bacterium]